MLAFLLLLLAGSVAVPDEADTPSADGPPAESVEALNVAPWLRMARPVPAEKSFVGMIGGPCPASLAPAEHNFIVENGVEALLENREVLDGAAAGLSAWSAEVFEKAARASIRWSRNVHSIPWALIEGPEGMLHFELLDTVVRESGKVGVEYLGTFAPFTPWALRCRGPAPESCRHLLQEDFYYLAHEGRMDLSCRPERIPELLGILAERYDGDGVDDAPGLLKPVRYWQMGNEVEAGEICGGYLGDLDAYLDWVIDGGAAIREACGDCRVVLGGALANDHHEEGRRGLRFWRDFVARGGGDAIDIVAIHYNEGKTGQDSLGDFEEMIRTYREIFGPKPIWVTEFGVLCGDGDAGGFVHLSETDAAAWYLRYYAIGLAAGVDRFFSDWIGFVDRGVIQLPYWSSHLCAVKLGGFTRAEKLSPSVVCFVVHGREILVAWGSGQLPPPFDRGDVLVTDLYGWSSVMSAANVLPREDPVFVERVPVRDGGGRPGF